MIVLLLVLWGAVMFKAYLYVVKQVGSVDILIDNIKRVWRDLQEGLDLLKEQSDQLKSLSQKQQ